MSGTKFKQVIEHPLKKPANVTEQQWQKALQIYDTAKTMGDKYPELTVAQAALETGWFKSMAGNYNYFGQKAGKNQKSVNLKTKEEGANGLYSTRANFRDYDTLEESIGDRIKKWGSKYAQAGNVQEALDIVVKNGYATASNYKTSVGGVLNSITGSNNQYSNKSVNNTPVAENNQERQGYSNKVVYQSPNLKNGSTALDTSTASYEEPVENTETQEVAQAKQEIQEKSFLEEVSKIMAQPQQEVVQQQVQEAYVSPDMADPYNYISLEEMPEEFQRGGRFKTYDDRLTTKDSTPHSKVKNEKELIKEVQDAEEFRKKGSLTKPKSALYKSIQYTPQQPIFSEEKRSEEQKKIDVNKGNQKEYRRKVKENVLKPLDVASDIAQLGNFIPHPIAQGVGKIGNFVGIAVDGTQAVDDFSDENYISGATNIGSMMLPAYLGSKTFRRNSKYLSPGDPLYNLSPQSYGSSSRVNYIEPFTQTRHMSPQDLNYNRGLLGALGAETYTDIEFEEGGAIVDPRGQWAHPGEVTIIPGNNITMQGVDYPVLGIDNLGNEQMMYPGQDYQFKGEYVTEYPQIKNKTNKRFQNEKKS